MLILSYSGNLVPVESADILEDCFVFKSVYGSTYAIPRVDFIKKSGKVYRFDCDLVGGIEYPKPKHNGKVFEVKEDEDGTYRIDNVPIFGCVVDDPKRPKIETEFLDSMVKNFRAMKYGVQENFDVDGKYLWLPKLLIGHSSDNLGELPVVGFVDNLRRIGKWLYCDFRYLSKDMVEDLRSGKYPDRSVEIDYDGKRLINVALLGSTLPYFRLPQMKRFSVVNELESYRRGSTRYEVFSWSSAMGSGVNSVDRVIGYMMYKGFTFDGSRDDLGKFMSSPIVSNLGGLEGILDILKRLMEERTTKIMNSGVQGKGNYSITLEDIKKYAQSGGDSSGVARDTQPDMEENPVGARIASDVDETGMPTKSEKHFMDDSYRGSIMKMIEGLDSKIRGDFASAFKSLFSTLDEQREYINKQAKALESLNNRFTLETKKAQEKERVAELEKYRAQLVVLRTLGSTIVGDEDNIREHLSIIESIPTKDGRDKYMDLLHKAPKRALSGIKKPIALTYDNSSTGSWSDRYLERFKSDPSVRAAAKRFGITLERAAICSAFADLDVEKMKEDSGSNLDEEEVNSNINEEI